MRSKKSEKRQRSWTKHMLRSIFDFRLHENRAVVKEGNDGFGVVGFRSRKKEEEGAE